MKFGVREICDVVFKAKAKGNIGKFSYGVGQPVLYIDSAKTSTLEGAATTVYATGGKGNNRLIAWEGEKTLTFTVEDALISPISLAILSGAGILDSFKNGKKVHVHRTAMAELKANSGKDGYEILLSNAFVDDKDAVIDENAPVFVMLAEQDDSLTGEFLKGFKTNTVAIGDTPIGQALIASALTTGSGISYNLGTDETVKVFVDFYVEKSEAVQEICIEEGTFGGNFYVEASTLFRRQIDGKDLPAELILPNVKIQSNFSFSMSSTGDPSAFTFTMDAFPGKTMFDNTKDVLCLIQVIDDTVVSGAKMKIDDSVATDTPHEKID